MFSEPLLKSICQGKYTRWAQNLTEEQLLVILSAVGEYGVRSFEPLQALHQKVPEDRVSYGRAVEALKVLSEFAHRKRIDMESFSDRIVQAAANACAEYKQRHAQ
jgi:hypothetical protein